MVLYPSLSRLSVSLPLSLSLSLSRMGRSGRERALAVAAVFHGVLTCAWFVAVVLTPGQAVWNNGLLLVGTFVATGLLGMHSHHVVALPYMAWAVALVDLLGLVPVALYMARLALARGSVGDTLWMPSGLVLTISALVLLGLTAATHLFTIIVCLRYIYARKQGSVES